jgi:hypothetical protein
VRTDPAFRLGLALLAFAFLFGTVVGYLWARL